MDTQVAVNSLAISKNKEGHFDFLKYNIEVSIEEIENKEDKNKLKYDIVLLSEPKNVRLAVDGIVEILGNVSERAKILEKDENNIPRVLHLIYEELFPIFFMTTKSIGVPCPAYRLSQISAPSEIEELPITEEQEIVSTTPEQPTTPESTVTNTGEQNIKKMTAEEKLVEEKLADRRKLEEEKLEAEKMTADELTQEYSKLSSEYQSNPSDELGSKLQKVSDLIQKRQQEQVVTKS